MVLLFAGLYPASYLRRIIGNFRATVGWHWRFQYIVTTRGEKQYHLVSK